jgi:hypothetical protein
MHEIFSKRLSPGKKMKRPINYALHRGPIKSFDTSIEPTYGLRLKKTARVGAVDILDSIVKQREDMRPHCRGAMRPSFASIATL